MYLALKEIKKEKLRFLMIVLVTALIAYLVYFLASLAFGLAQLNKTAVDHWQAQGIIVAKEANQNIYASSIDIETLEALGLSAEDGINIATTTIYINDDKDQGKQPENLVLMGYHRNNQKLAPKIIEGRSINDSHEITVSYNFKDKVDIQLNDIVTIAKTGRTFKVVGFTENANYNTIPVGYVSQEMASQAMMIYTTNNPQVDAVASPTPNMPARVSAMIVSDEISLKGLEGADLEYLPITDFINAIPGYQAQILTFGFMIIALALISSIIIGIFMYILTMQKKPIFGVLKIQGYRDGYIMRSVIYQSIILILVGFGLGLVLTLLTVTFLPAKVPVEVFWPLNIGATLFAFGCSIIGTVFSARSVLKIDPLAAL